MLVLKLQMWCHKFLCDLIKVCKPMKKTIAFMIHRVHSWILIPVGLPHIVPISLKLSIMRSLKCTWATPFFAVTPFRLSLNKVGTTLFSDCIPQHTIVRTLQYLVLYTWHVIVVYSFKSSTWSNMIQKFFMSLHIACASQTPPTICKVHRYIEDKHLVL